MIVHPHRTAKSGKFDCTVMSLSVLLDYRPEDNKVRNTRCPLVGGRHLFYLILTFSRSHSSHWSIGLRVVGVSFMVGVEARKNNHFLL